MFLENNWYAAGWDHEIKGTPLARTICQRRIVLFRRPDGSLVALDDCCPHRMLPLSKGFLRDGHLVCGYHGLEFDHEGRCVRMPNQKGVQQRTKVTAYPVVERHRFAWVWIGESALADEEQIPDLRWCSDPEWVFDGAFYYVKANYLLLIDNLMDLTHETYVHPSSIGQHEIVEAPIETAWDDRSVTVTRWMHRIDPPPFWATTLKSNQKCDRWQICRFSLPANVVIDVGVAITGTGAAEGDRSRGITGMVINLMTPETETSTWYFWGMARNFEIRDLGLTTRIREAQGAVFAEDVEILEAQQENILKRPESCLMNLNIDAGGVCARRIIDRHLSGLSDSVPAAIRHHQE